MTNWHNEHVMQWHPCQPPRRRKTMKPYIIRRLIAAALSVFWIAVALAAYFILR